MNKFGVAIILVAASVCLVSAAPKAPHVSGGHHTNPKHIEDVDDEFNVEPIPVHGGPGHRPVHLPKPHHIPFKGPHKQQGHGIEGHHEKSESFGLHHQHPEHHEQEHNGQESHEQPKKGGKKHPGHHEQEHGSKGPHKQNGHGLEVHHEKAESFGVQLQHPEHHEQQSGHGFGHKHHGPKQHHGGKKHGHHDNSEQDQYEPHNGHHEKESHEHPKKGGKKHGGPKHLPEHFGHHEQPEHDSFQDQHEQCCGQEHHSGHNQHGHKQPGHKHGFKHFGHFEQPEHQHQQEQSEEHGHQGHFGHAGKHGLKGGFKHGIRPRKVSGSAFDEVEASKGSLHLQDEEKGRLHAEGNKFGTRAGAKGIIAGKFNKNHNSDTGLRQHQEMNIDRTIIKDKSNGKNDLEFSHRVSDSKEAGAVAAGAVGAETEFASGRLDAEKEHESDLSAQNAAFKEKEGAQAEFSDF